MHIPGHLAVALLQKRFLVPQSRQQRAAPYLITAALFPDVVDKSLGYLVRLMPNGRHYAHNLFGLVLISALVTLIWGRLAGYAWLVGHLGHLLADASSTVPWFFPLKRYPIEEGGFELAPAQALRESLFLGLLLILLRPGRHT